MESKFKPNDIVFWGRSRDKYIVREFQPTNGIFGSYWLKDFNSEHDAVASEDELCYEGEFIRDEIIILKMLEIMFPLCNWLSFKEEFIKNGSKNLDWVDKAEEGTLDFMAKMFQIMDQKFMMLIYDDYIENPIESDICDLNFLGIYTHVTFNEWISSGAHLPFSYVIVTNKFNQINQRNLHIMHLIRNYEYNDEDDSNDIKAANV